MADILTKFKDSKRKDARSSVYSMVSCSELTPGSLEVWVDLPEEIKHDPHLAPFKQLYEQQHGKLDFPDSIYKNHEGELLTKKLELSTIDDSLDDKTEDTRDSSGLRLMETLTPSEEKKIQSPSKSLFLRSLRVVKLSGLIACWLLLTVSLIMNKETEESVLLHTAVKDGEVKEYSLTPSDGSITLSVDISGPFDSNYDKKNITSNSLLVWLQKSYKTGEQYHEQNSSIWQIVLKDDNAIDFAPGVTKSKNLVLEILDSTVYKNSSKNNEVLNQNVILDKNKLNSETKSEKLKINLNETKVSLRLYASGNLTVPLTINYKRDPLSEKEGLIYASLLLCMLYVLIVFEIINRTIAAVLTSSLGIAVLAMTGDRPSLGTLVSWLDVETLLLLFSMMLLVALLAETGLFDYLAVKAFEITGGQTWPLINCLCFCTAVFSTFLDNVTTVLLMTPVTIRLCEVMQLNPVPVLMSMVIFSNVGGAATPVGDPPNVIIANHPSIIKENINFTTFTVHMGVGILLVSVQTYLQLRFMFRDINKLRHAVPTEIQEIRQELAVWRRAAASLSSYSRDEDIVRKALEKNVEKLNSTLKKREKGRGSSKSDPKFCSTLAQMKEKYCIRDMPLLIKSAVCVSFVVAVFFLHSIPQLECLSLGWTALLGAILLLLISERDDLEPILARVEWSTLLFFAALFVLMEALSKLGLISWIGNITESIILKVDEEARLATALMLVLWVSGLVSAFVDNIPLTTMMVRVTARLASPNGLGLPLAPLAWALSFGACLGGNGTLIGASANVVCAGVAEQHGYRFTFLQFLKIGFPIMVGNLVVASVYLLFCHCVVQWH